MLYKYKVSSSEELPKKYIELSKNVAVIFYDSDCELCKATKNFAINILRSNKINAANFSLQHVLGRKLNNQDNFMFVYKGTIYEGHEAIIEILRFKNGVYRALANLTKFKPFMFMAYCMYKFISRIRKHIYKRKGCNCE